MGLLTHELAQQFRLNTVSTVFNDPKYYVSVLYSRVDDPSQGQRLLRHQHPARPQLCPETTRRHLQRQRQGGGALQNIYSKQEERYKQGEEKTARTCIVI